MENEPSWVKEPSTELESQGYKQYSIPLVQSDERMKINIFGCDTVLCYFRIFHGCVSFLAFLTLMENAYLLREYSSVRELIIRVYAILFCVLSILIEMEFRAITENLLALESWFSRSLFYIL